MFIGLRPAHTSLPRAESYVAAPLRLVRPKICTNQPYHHPGVGQFEDLGEEAEETECPKQ